VRKSLLASWEEELVLIVFGALINGLEAFVGGVIGLLFKSRVSKKLGEFLLQGQGLCVVLVAVQGMLAGGSIVLTTLSVALGALVGYTLHIDSSIHHLGDRVQQYLEHLFTTSATIGNFSEGFVSATLFTCTGAMAIVGSLASGLSLDHSTLITKGLIDLVCCMPMAAAMGVGVPLCAVPLIIYEGTLSLLAATLAPLLSDAVITQMGVTGSLLLLAVGTNLLRITAIKVADLLPACFLPIILVPLAALAPVAL
jgi:uncharacterized membrane protein YqgA involved in biofilm formation